MSFYDRFQNAEWTNWAVQKGIRDALIKHKALGVAIAVWKDGQVVLVPPEEIEIPELGPRPSSRSQH